MRTPNTLLLGAAFLANAGQASAANARGTLPFHKLCTALKDQS